MDKYFDDNGLIAAVIIKFGERMVFGDPGNAIAVTQSIPPGMVVCGLSVKTTRMYIKDVSLRMYRTPSFDELQWQLARLRVLQASVTVKNDAVLKALITAIKRVASMHTRGVVSVSPLISSLKNLCATVKKHFRPGPRALWRSRSNRSLSLVCICEALDKVAAVLDCYEDAEAECLMSQALDGDHSTLREFTRQVISSSSMARFVSLHAQYPQLFFKIGVFDRLTAYLIQSGRVEELNRVASAHTSALGSTVPAAIADLAGRVLVIWLAIANSRIESVYWLIGVAQIDPLSTPAAPSPPELDGLPDAPLT